jgi:hypothetical protein
MFAIFPYGILLVVATKDRNLFADLAKESPPQIFGNGATLSLDSNIENQDEPFIIIEKYI